MRVSTLLAILAAVVLLTAVCPGLLALPQSAPEASLPQEAVATMGLTDTGAAGIAGAALTQRVSVRVALAEARCESVPAPSPTVAHRLPTAGGGSSGATRAPWWRQAPDAAHPGGGGLYLRHLNLRV